MNRSFVHNLIIKNCLYINNNYYRLIRLLGFAVSQGLVSWAPPAAFGWWRLGPFGRSAWEVSQGGLQTTMFGWAFLAEQIGVGRRGS